MVFTCSSCNGISAPASDSDSVSHQIWNSLLQKHVNEKGLVDYTGFANDKKQLESYLDHLSKNAPNKRWSEDENLAYWINAYNAFTIQLILNNYPVKSIKDIGEGPQITFVNSPWDIKFIHIGGKELDLNNIEHGIIRKDFDDPRIHFALVCAARSCPELRNEAYTGEALDEQLEEEAISFINNPDRNQLSQNNVVLSKYFDWYSGDFKKKGSIIDFINQYSKTKINPSAKISFKEYDWSLNKQQ